MKEEPYIEALKKAQEELAECDAAAHELDCKRARLRQTIVGLQSLMGMDVQEEKPHSQTEAIRSILKVTPGLTSGQVSDRLVEMGYEPEPRSVATILSRLAKAGQIMHDSTNGYSYGSRAAVISRMRQKRMKARKTV
jgi:hypothetical protein